MCLALISQVENIARQQRATSVKTVIIRIGPLSGVEPDLLAQAFPLASAGTVAEASKLVIENLPIRVRCQSCGAESAAKANRLVCGQCGDWRTQLLSGDEMLLASVELESNAEQGMRSAG